MADDGVFLRGIPKFLRRLEEPLPEDPVFMAAQDTGAPPPADIPAVIQASADAPARRPGALVPPPPVHVAPETPEVVSLQSHRAAPVAPGPGIESTPSSGDFFAAARSGIAGFVAAEARNNPNDEDDAAFQVTLPRSVIRQIRILAAQEGTTQRAIVLRALRLAGLAVPEGADIDRRILAGRRRQQA